jgi:uncharacterized protein
MLEWERVFEEKIREVASNEDPAHDILHFKRVVSMARYLCLKEGGKLQVVIPAAWLHDFVIIPKSSLLRSQASRLSAKKAVEFLSSIQYPPQYLDAISHAIEGHSFSANLEVKTLEAKIVQDADRLDGIGAIGVARCFATAGLLKRPFYCSDDPMCTERLPDDNVYTVDHFYKKLFKTAETLKTASGLEEGFRRVEVMRHYLNDLSTEIKASL